ncbi:MAG: hypothetical protein EA405_10505 [Rhodospirillales bacterium]|nr:MAG: hypothetical protein EA405_10505 [Rhodospirillales bacterium]
MTGLGPWLPWIVLALIVLLAAVVVGVLVWVWRRNAGSEGTETADGVAAADDDQSTAPSRPVSEAARSGVQAAMARLQGLTGPRDHPYAVPWVAMVSLEGARASEAIAGLELNQAGEGALAPVIGVHCTFRFTQDGAIVDVDEGLLSSRGWGERWNTLLRSIRLSRPERPLDGLVVAVPVADLIGPAALTPDRLSAAGGQLYELIWSIQRLTGLRVPIYVMLTGCEAVDGFRDLAAALPEAARDDVLGWSVPYALDTAYAPRWIDEGVDQLVQDLTALQLQVLMRLDDPAAADAVFLFPGQVRRLRDPLRILLTGMLRTSAYHEAFLFRGFYLTGTVAGQEAAEGRPVAGRQADGEGEEVSEPAAGRAAFVRGLFAKKVFREYQLARPAAGALTVRHRRVRIAQGALAAILVLALIGIATVAGTSGRITSARQLVDTLDRQIDRVTAERQRTEMAELNLDQVADAAFQVLAAMSRLQVTTVETWAAPTSLLTGADRRVERAIGVGYETSVLVAVRIGLSFRLNEVLADADRILRTPAGSAARPPAERVERALSGLSSGLARYAQAMTAFEGLPRTQSIDDLADLIDYALDKTLPPGFRDNRALYEKALRNVRVPASRAVAYFESMLEEVIARAAWLRYPQGPLAVAVESLEETARRILDDSPEMHRAACPVPGSGLGLGGTTPDDTDRAETLRNNLRLIKEELSGDGSLWLDPGVADPDPVFSEVLTRVRALDLVSESFADHLDTIVDNARAIGRADLAAARFAGEPVLLVSQVDHRWTVAPALLALRDALEALFRQPFMADVPAAPVAVADPGRPLRWEPPVLQQGMVRAESYLVFASRDLGRLRVRGDDGAADGPEGCTTPDCLMAKMIARNIALDRVCRHAQATVAQAARPLTLGAATSGAGDAALRAEVRNFAAAQPLLSRLRDTWRQVGLDGPAAALDGLATEQATRLLDGVDRLLQVTAPYQPLDPTFSWWNGEEPLAATSFGAASVADLAGMLALPRDFMDFLARDLAEPLVQYLGGGRPVVGAAAGTRPQRLVGDTLARWTGIIAALNGYDQNQPRNSLRQLERFILEGMDEITLDNCQARTQVVGRPRDYFEEQEQSLRRALASRCARIQQQQAVTAYGAIRDEFNQRLAGRFPFVGLGLGVDPSAALMAPRADPGQVRRFFARFDEAAENAQAQLGGGARARAATAFLSQLAAVRDALAPMLVAPGVDMPLSYQLDLAFRTNPSQDRGGNQVLEWIFEVADRRVTSFQAAPTITWTYGEPVRVSLRWARNAPQVPAPSGAAGPVVQDTTATFSYTDPWAVLSLIAGHTPDRARMVALSDQQGSVVELEVPLQRNPEAAAGGVAAPDRARVYLNIGFTALIQEPGQPEERQALELPVFPAAAPDL